MMVEGDIAKMEKNKLEKQVEELNRFLHEYGHAYHVLNKSLVPDAIYDQYIRELIK